MQFRLVKLFMVIGIAALISLGLRYRYLNRPVSFEPYSAQRLSERLKAGDAVIVVINANWSLSSEFQRDYISQELGRPLRRHRVATLEADWTTRSRETQSLMEQLGITRLPATALFTPASPDSPTVYRVPIDEDKLLSSIEALH